MLKRLGWVNTKKIGVIIMIFCCNGNPPSLVLDQKAFLPSAKFRINKM